MPARTLQFDCDAVVVHEGDGIDETRVRAANARAGGNAVHLAADDAVLPEGGNVRWLRVPSMRSGEFRDYAVERVEALLSTASADDALQTGGVDLAQVALIDWAHRAGEALLHEWICERIAAAGVKHVVWVPAARRYAREFAMDLCSRLTHAGITATSLDTVALPAARLALLRFNNAATAAMQSMRGRRGPRQARPVASPRPRVLFAENYPKTAILSAAVARAIEMQGGVDVWFVLTRRDTEAAVRPLGLTRVVHLEDLASPSSWRASMEGQKRAVRAARAGRLQPGARFLGERFTAVTESQLRHAAHMTALWNDAVRAIGPDVIATTSQANIFARAAVAAGHRAGATSFLIQHGLLGHDRFESRVLTERQLLWGEWDTRRRIALGFDPRTLTATGSPAIEPMLANGDIREDPWSAAASLKVLYAPTLTSGQWMSPLRAAAQLEMVAGAVRAIPGAELVIKIHPSEPSSLFDGAGARVFRDGTAVQLIPHADVVICSTSTSGLEACALDKPVIVLRAPDVRTFPQYEEHGAVLFASDTDSLAASLESIRTNDEVREKLRHGRRAMNKDLFFGLRPGAADRMAAAIRSCALERDAAPGAPLTKAV